jgi:hypothetical protein
MSSEFIKLMFQIQKRSIQNKLVNILKKIIDMGEKCKFIGGFNNFSTFLENIVSIFPSLIRLTHQITDNDIAARLLRISKVPMDANYVRETKRTLRQKRREITVDATISADFCSCKIWKSCWFRRYLPGIHKKRRDKDQRMNFIIPQ